MRDRFRFHSGRISLAFVATWSGRYRADGYDQLAVPEDLGHWLQAAGLTVDVPPVRPAELIQARELREATYRLVQPTTRDRPGRDDIDVVNLCAGHSGLRPVLGGDARSKRMVPAQPVRACLAHLALDAIDILTGSLLEHVRECARHDCSILFLDTSRAQQRRWCAMSTCGNRTKVARHRQRDRPVTSNTR
jgi:predicted RNA-binding Zn ribbon-like protein